MEGGRTRSIERCRRPVQEHDVLGRGYGRELTLGRRVVDVERQTAETSSCSEVCCNGVRVRLYQVCHPRFGSNFFIRHPRNRVLSSSSSCTRTDHVQKRKPHERERCTGRLGTPSTFGTGLTPERVGRFLHSAPDRPVTWSRQGSSKQKN